eukprot:3323901-Pleurochrysis_carterae.AAC.4
MQACLHASACVCTLLDASAIASAIAPANASANVFANVFANASVDAPVRVRGAAVGPRQAAEAARGAVGGGDRGESLKHFSRSGGGLPSTRAVGGGCLAAVAWPPSRARAERGGLQSELDLRDEECRTKASASHPYSLRGEPPVLTYPRAPVP